MSAGGGLFLGIFFWLVAKDHPNHLSGNIKPLEDQSSLPVLVGLKLALRQKQTWVMTILGATMSSTLLAF